MSLVNIPTVTAGQISAAKLQARPVNYGINQISLGVDGSLNGVSVGRIVIARGVNGYPGLPVGGVNTVTFTLVSGTIYKFTPTGGSNRDFRAGSYVWVLYNLAGTPRINQACKVVDVVGTSEVQVDLEKTITSGNAGLVIAVPNGDVIYTEDIGTVSTATTQLGISAAAHVFDSGEPTTTSTTPQGSGVTGNKNYYGLEAYYSVYIKPISTWSLLTTAKTTFVKDYGWYRDTAPGPSYGTWKYDATKSTAQWMLNHLPAFFTVDSFGTYNNDLVSFIKLLAFGFDSWKTATDTVYARTSAAQIDAELLSLYLNQLGVSFSAIDKDPFLGKKLLSNLIRSYKLKGSTNGIALSAELFTGYQTSVATTGKNLIPDVNAANFIEGPILSPFWTIATSTTLPSGTTTVEIARRSSPTGTKTAYINNGFMELTTYASQPVVITGQPRYMITSGVVATGASQIPVRFNQVYVGDYVIHPSVPVGGIVTTVAYPVTATAAGAITTVTINVTTSAQIAATSTISLSLVGPDYVAAAAKMIPVNTNNLGTLTSLVNATSVSGTTTYTTKTAHGYTVGQTVWVEEINNAATNTGFNTSSVGETIATVTATTFAIAKTVTGTTYVSGGVANTVRSTYSYSFYANAWNLTGMPDLQPMMSYYKADGTLIYTTYKSPAVNISGTNVWQRLTYDGINPPINAVYAAPGVQTTSDLGANKPFSFDAFQFEEAASTTTYADPGVTNIVATAISAVRPYSDAVLAKGLYNLKDNRTSSFIPQGTAVSTTYTVVEVKDQSTPTEFKLPNYDNGLTTAWSQATMVLQTGTNNIIAGQTFSLVMTTAANPAVGLSIKHGLVLGVISSKEYRIVRRDISGAGSTITNTTTSMTNNLFVNAPLNMVVSTAVA